MTEDNNHAIPRNIVVFGQTGAGKSSIINMLAGLELAEVSGDAVGCTTSNQAYYIPNKNDNTYTFLDTPGLNEADNGTVSSQAAFQNLLNLVKEHDVNLLIYCIRGRLVDIIRFNYDVFWKIICMEKVPIVIVVTGLEGKHDMDAWWRENEKTIKRMGMSFGGHACITSWKGERNRYEREYDESAEKVWKLVMQHCSPTAWRMPPEWSAQGRKSIEVYIQHTARSENRMQKFFKGLVRFFSR